MVIRNSQLLTFIQELKQLIADDLCQEQVFGQIAEDLDEIARDLNSEKLRVHLVSVDRDLAKAFHSILDPKPNLEKNYQFQIHDLLQQPSRMQNPSPAFLILQEFVEGSEKPKQTRYPLSAKDVLQIGRKPGCDIHIPDQYTRVSGRHLEVHYCPPTDTNPIPQWRIQDCEGCKNGTYINGEPLVEKRLLKDGDRLVLGDKNLSSKSPEFIFEYQLHNDGSLAEKYSSTLNKLVNCDILFLVLGSDREPLEEEKKLLELAHLTPGLEVFLVTSLHATVQVLQVTQQNQTSINIENLNQQVFTAANDKIPSPKTQRIVVQITSIINRIEQALTGKQEKIKQEIEKVESQSLQENKTSAVEDVSFLLKSINEQKTSLIRAIEASLNQSRQDLLDDTLADSITQKLQRIVDELEAHVIKQKDQKYLKLRPPNSELNVNDFIVQFCERELLSWADQEWRKICQQYGNGGLVNLVKNSNITLKAIGEKRDRNFTLHLKQKIEIDGVFQASLRRVPDAVEYQEEPAWAYFIKKIRSSVFQVMGILFLLSFLGISRTKAIKIVNQQISGSIFLSAFVVGMMLWLVYKLYKIYQKDKVIEIRKASEKIRQELVNYYQKVIKNRFADKLSQRLDVALKEETNRFDESIKSFLAFSGKPASETKSSSMDLRGYLRDIQSQGIKLERKLRDFQRAKDKLQRLRSSS